MSMATSVPVDGPAAQVNGASVCGTSDTQLMQRVAHIASVVNGKPFKHWPAWSTGEILLVALVLDNAVVLKAMGYSILEALDRVELSPRQLQQIARRVR